MRQRQKVQAVLCHGPANRALTAAHCDHFLHVSRTYPNLANLQPHKPDIWMTGDASSRAANGVQQLGLALTQQCGKQLPLLD